MIDVSLFEPANPLIPVDQLPYETQIKPIWNIRKLSMARINQQAFIKVMKETTAKLDVVQEDKEIPQKAEKMPIYYSGTIDDPSYTSNIIYESYKPNCLQQIKEYFHFIINYRKILPNFPEIRSNFTFPLDRYIAH